MASSDSFDSGTRLENLAWRACGLLFRKAFRKLMCIPNQPDLHAAMHGEVIVACFVRLVGRFRGGNHSRCLTPFGRVQCCCGHHGVGHGRVCWNWQDVGPAEIRHILPLLTFNMDLRASCACHLSSGEKAGAHSLLLRRFARPRICSAGIGQLCDRGGRQRRRGSERTYAVQDAKEPQVSRCTLHMTRIPMLHTIQTTQNDWGAKILQNDGGVEMVCLSD